MVGEGVLQECLGNPEVGSVTVINRRPCGIIHPKLTEILHGDFFDLRPVADRLTDLDACFFCLGVSSVNMSDEKYYATTYALTLNFAGLLSEQNPGMTFCYVSGAGTDSTEKGMLKWARVKGKTENDLRKLPFKGFYAFRPGFMLPSKDAKNVPSYLKYITPAYPVFHAVFPRFLCTLKEVGMAMIKCATTGYEKSVLEVPDIVNLAKR